MTLTILIVSLISLAILSNYLVRMLKIVKDLLYKETNKEIINKKLANYSIFPFCISVLMFVFTLITSILLLKNTGVNTLIYWVSFIVLLLIVVIFQIAIFKLLAKFQRKFDLPKANLIFKIACHFVPAIVLYIDWNILNAIIAHIN